MPTNLGSQIVTIKYYDPVDSYLVNIRHEATRPVGIYKGGHATITNAATGAVSLSPLVCEISDGTYQVRVETSVAVSKVLVESSAEYLILRWNYTGATSDYMEILATNSFDSNDLIIGKGIWTAGSLTSIVYTERTVPDQHRYFLKIEPTETPGTSVRVRPGRVHSGSGFLSIVDQLINLGAYSVGNVVYIYINDTGGVTHSATAATYAGMALLAKVTIPADGILDEDQIEDARCFIDSPAIPDNTTIQRSSTGKLKLVDGVISLYTPRWSVSVADNLSYSVPAQFLSLLAEFSIPSFGSIRIHGDKGDNFAASNSNLWTMTVNSNGTQTKTLKLFYVDDNVYVFVRGVLVFSQIGVYDSASVPRNVTLNLVNGNNLIQVVYNDIGGVYKGLCLVGNIIDNTNVLFVS